MASRRSRIQIRPNLSRGTPGAAPSRPKKPDVSKVEGSDNVQITDQTMPHSSDVPKQLSAETSTEEPTTCTTESLQKQMSDPSVSPHHVPIKNTSDDPALVVALTTKPVPVETAHSMPEAEEKSKSSSVVKTPTVGRRSRIKPQVQIRSMKPNATTSISNNHSRNLGPVIEVISEKGDQVSSADAKKGVELEHVETVTNISSATIIKSSSPKKINIEDEPSEPRNTDSPAHNVTVLGKSTKEQVKDDVTSELITSQEEVKSPAKRSRFMRAKPNFLEAERRRQRLSSMSESEDSVAPRRTTSRGLPHVDSSQQNSPTVTHSSNLKSNDHHVTTETRTKDIPDEKLEEKAQTKIKRRLSCHLDGLVSENRSKLTISDLIHMNPVSNPMKRYLNKEPKKVHVQDTADKENPAADVTPDPITPDPQSPGPPTGSVLGSPQVTEVSDDAEKENEEALPVPQVMIGPDGQIILNDASLVIDNPAIQADPTVMESDVVVDNDNYNPSFYYKSRKRSLLWGIKETTKFYVALSTVGTDFSLMVNLFPKRNRTELKRKFKQEERKHKTLVDKALVERRTLDMSIFEASDNDDDDRSTGEDQEMHNEDSIKQKVKAILEKEKKRSCKKKAKSKATPIEIAKKEVNEEENGKVDNKTDNESTNKAAHKRTIVGKKTIRKKKKGRSSRYYDGSSDDSAHEAKLLKVITDLSDEDDGALSSGDEMSTLERLSGSTTRSGRQPKRVKTFTIPESKKRKRTPRSKSILKLSTTHIDPQLTPLVSTPPSGTSHEILEDTETGQRLLLVKSPPPVGDVRHKDRSSDYIHVYLMSPSSSTRRHPSEGGYPGVTIPDTGEVFVPPSVASPSPVTLQEEVITEDVQIVDMEVESAVEVQDVRNIGCNVFHAKNLPNWSQQNSQSRSKNQIHFLQSSPPYQGLTELKTSQSASLIDTRTGKSPSYTHGYAPTPTPAPMHSSSPTHSHTPTSDGSQMASTSSLVRTPEQQVPNAEAISTEYTSMSLKEEQTVLEMTQQEASQLYENAEILTVTDTGGQIVEILIDPGLTTKHEEGDIIDLQVTHSISGNVEDLNKPQFTGSVSDS